MKKRPFPKKSLSCFLPILVVVLMLFLLRCGSGPEQEDAAVRAVPVQVVLATAGDLQRNLSFSGTVQPWREASLGAQMPGKIESIFVEVGEQVDAGELLVQMTGEQLTQAQAQLTSVEKDWNRMKSLLEKGTITQQAFDQIEAGYQAAKASYELVLESTRIKAPFSGTITAKYLEEGEVFTLFPGPSGSPAILHLSQMDTVKVTLEVSEREIPEIEVGLAAKVKLDSYPHQSFEGKVHLVEPAADHKTHTIGVEILIPNHRRMLKPGMFAEVSIHLGAFRGLLVPRDALLRELGTGKYHIFVVEGDTARRRQVVPGEQYGEMVAIEGGLNPGESVITVGKTLVHQGTPVSVIKKEKSD